MGCVLLFFYKRKERREEKDEKSQKVQKTNFQTESQKEEDKREGPKQRRRCVTREIGKKMEDEDTAVIRKNGNCLAKRSRCNHVCGTVVEIKKRWKTENAKREKNRRSEKKKMGPGK